MSEVLVVGPHELRPGDEIVGVQRRGAGDTVSPRSNKIVEVGASEDPVTGGECIPLRRRASDPDWYELNLWKGSEYGDDTLFHVQRT
ncbi:MULTISPECIES: hypothetical protein [Mycobacterium]|uniref:Uncharacterized protein n=1 Tax=Mycobacterium bouchedurhonense TaxID=701041 RepID=A0AAW5S834_MYCBC|nr:MULTISPECIES: hypothetical protein [Mycobacterium]MCV6990832.1 hypothetical protein [Mycobacterium bouchedurhonense]MCV6997382.1 hypothetical protein [Mycobacterium timonense]QWY65287.1 hypothetical protein BJP78_26770 [Mycobacterium avium subsp. hominissuis]